MDSSRPDPDEILKSIKEQQGASSRAYFRIFMGMSAGVGKTYAMLKAAHQKKQEGLDVVIGVVETHGRKETEELVEGLELIPKKRTNYRGTDLLEMDLDAILLRKPQLVVVDELPHTNIPGSRHEKRYQDIIELLQNGIQVYTAINVQHLESRKDTVESITGISIYETVPDRILEMANQIELVDISPNELLKRLKEGKIYLGDKAERAAQNFFKEDKLTALREIALRMTAERVDQDLQKLVLNKSETGPWQTNERLLVAISHSPFSEKVIRATRRLAYNLDAPWIALYVDTGIQLNDLDQAQLVKNLNLAKELNAEVITTTEMNVSSAVRRVCRQKNVTQVVIGRPTRRWFRDLLEGGAFLERLLQESTELDIHIVRSDSKQKTQPKIIDEILYYQSQTPFLTYWYTIWAVIGVSFLSFLLENFLGYRSVGFIFLLGVSIIGTLGSLGSVILAALMSAVIWDYFFIPPQYTFLITNSEDILMCFSLFSVAVITGFLTNRIRSHEKLIRERERKTHILYEILKDITVSTDKNDFLKKVLNRTSQIFDSTCGVIIKDRTSKLIFGLDKNYNIELSSKDQAVAQWSFDHAQNAGWSSDTLSESKILFIPLVGETEKVGVFVLKPNRPKRKMDLENQNLLLSIVSQLGASLEKHLLMKRLIEAQRLKDSEELHQTLLNSISHEMRTPLTAILSASTSLEAIDVNSDFKSIQEIARGIRSAGIRLNRVVENLLDMSRIHSGVLSLNKEWYDMNDLVGVVISKMREMASEHPIHANLVEGSILFKIDFRLMEHALSNILLNAVLYTPKNSDIWITSEVENGMYILKIIDSGPGIPDEDKFKIFEKFYRLPGALPGGTGLGLSIVKSIVELHGGRIMVEDHKPTGSCFKLFLNLEPQPQAPPESL